MNNHYVLAIDGGGTHCRVGLYTLEAQCLAKAQSGPCNLQRGVDAACQAIEQALGLALEQASLAKLPRSKLLVGAGLAGLVGSDEREQMQTYGQAFGRFSVQTDAYTACLGAHQGQDGGIVILGTGSCALARIQGKTHQFGGWGLALSDHASGARLGQLALQQTLLALEQLQPSSLLSERLSEHFDHSPLALLRFSQHAQPADYGQFAPWVFQAASDKDPIAETLLQQQEALLWQLVERLQQQHCPRISLVGGLAGAYHARLSAERQRQLQPAQGDALLGGFYLAKHALDAHPESPLL